VEGLFCGLVPVHLSWLCENQWLGGRSYTPKEVGEMTVDQVMFALADRKHLRKHDGRTVAMEPSQVTSLSTTKDGLVKGRDKEGNVIYRPFRGKSRARELMEQEKAKRDDRKNRRRRRRGR